MSYRVEILDASLTRERQAALVAVLVAELGVEPETAELTALVTPCVVGPVATVAEREQLLAALATAGFAARPAVPDTAGAFEAAPSAPAVVAAPAPPPPAPPPLAVAPVAEPAEAPVARSNRGLVALAAGLGVVAVGLAFAAFGTDDEVQTDTVVVEPARPTVYAPEDDVMEGDTVMIDEPMEDEVRAPERPRDDPDFRLGFSPGRGVNWDVFERGGQVRRASAPGGYAVPVRDVPSRNHGTVLAEVPPGGQVQTSGCLPRRPEDGGRWCRTGYGGSDGWIYDRYLAAGAPPRPPYAPPPPDGGVQIGRNADGEVTLTLAEGGRVRRMPRNLSAGTSVSNVQRRTLAGRDIVQFEARDVRWATTYYWEPRAGVLHFVGQDRRTGGTNVSDQPGSYDVIYAARGGVPATTAGPRAPRAPARAPASSYLVLLGSYVHGDDYGLQGRLAQAQQTGLALQVVDAEQYGLRAGYTIICVGPYDRATADRVLAGVRPYVPDAVLSPLR